MMWRRQRNHTGGAPLGHLRRSAVMVLRIESCARNGRLLSIGGMGSAGDAATPSFLGQRGNWGMMIMTGLFTGDRSTGRAINQVRASKRMRIDGEKNLRRSHAQNGDMRMQNNGENNAKRHSVFSHTPFAKPARLESSLSPANGVAATQGPERGREPLVIVTAAGVSPELRSAVLDALRARSEGPWGGWSGE